MSEETTKIHGVDYLTWGRMDWAARCQVMTSELYKTKERLGELETEAIKDGIKLVVYKLQIEALEKKVEELQKIVANYHGSDKLMNWMVDGGIYATEKMIGEAVEIADYSIANQPIVWNSLNELHIFRCKWCKGTGKMFEWGHGDEKQVCNVCHGKKYLIGNDDE